MSSLYSFGLGLGQGAVGIPTPEEMRAAAERMAPPRAPVVPNRGQIQQAAQAVRERYGSQVPGAFFPPGDGAAMDIAAAAGMPTQRPDEPEDTGGTTVAQFSPGMAAPVSAYESLIGKLGQAERKQFAATERARASFAEAANVSRETAGLAAQAATEQAQQKQAVLGTMAELQESYAERQSQIMQDFQAKQAELSARRDEAMEFSKYHGLSNIDEMRSLKEQAQSEDPKRAGAAKARLARAQEYNASDAYGGMASKMAAIFATAIGGYVQARTGAPNPGLQMMNEAMDDYLRKLDRIAGQRKERVALVDRKMAENLKMFDDKRTALLMREKQMLGAARTRMEAAGAMAEGTQKQVAAQQMIAGIMEREAKVDLELESQNYKTAVSGIQARAQAAKSALPETKQQISASVASKMGGFNAATEIADSLWQTYKSKVRPYVGGALQFVPATKETQYEDERKMAAQIIGKSIEGRMTDEDFARFYNMLPAPGDSEGRAKAKISAIKSLIKSKRKSEIDTLKKAKFDVSEFEEPSIQTQEATPARRY